MVGGDLTIISFKREKFQSDRTGNRFICGPVKSVSAWTGKFYPLLGFKLHPIEVPAAVNEGRLFSFSTIPLSPSFPPLLAFTFSAKPKIGRRKTRMGRREGDEKSRGGGAGVREGVNIDMRAK